MTLWIDSHWAYIYSSSIEFGFSGLSVNSFLLQIVIISFKYCGLFTSWSCDWGCGSPTSCQSHILHVFVIMFTLRKKISYVHGRNLCCTEKHVTRKLIIFWICCSSPKLEHKTLLKCVPTTPLWTKEAQINLPNKFDENFSKFQSFFNQVNIIIWLELHCCPIGLAQIDFTNTLIS